MASLFSLDLKQWLGTSPRVFTLIVHSCSFFKQYLIFVAAKGAIYYVAMATVIFSAGGDIIFRAKAHLVFH